MWLFFLVFYWVDAPQDLVFLDVHDKERAPAAYIGLDYADYQTAFETYLTFFQPVPFKKITPQIIDSYGKHRVRPDGSTRLHQGWDMKAPVGTVLSWRYPADVKVIISRDSEWDGNAGSANYGKQLFLKTTIAGKTHIFRLAHLDEVSVTQGQTITAQQIRNQQFGIKLGTVGISGRKPTAKNPHLHLEVWDGNWQLLNTQDFFN